MKPPVEPGQHWHITVQDRDDATMCCVVMTVEGDDVLVYTHILGTDRTGAAVLNVRDFTIEDCRFIPPGCRDPQYMH